MPGYKDWRNLRERPFSVLGGRFFSGRTPAET
jgi:hypothetical protein